MIRTLVVAAVVCGILDSGGRRAEAPSYGPLPGDTLARFEGYRGKLQKTGGIASPHLRAGFSFEVWEDHRGREYTFSKTFLPCDPADTTGVAYLPKTVLLVQRSPDGQKVVVGEKRAMIVKSDAEVDRLLAAEEKFVAANQEPPQGIAGRLKRWWRGLTKEPFMQFVYDDGHIVISKGEAFLPKGGLLIDLVLAPFFEGADLSGAPGEGEGEAVPEGEPTPVATPIATDSLRAPIKILRYLKPYESFMLENLAQYVDDRRKKPRRRPLYRRRD